MNTQSKAHAELLNKIIKKELAMFLSTKNEGGTANCQKNTEAFELMRWMAHAIHNEATLLSYYSDLEQAEAIGRNFMIEKYARMDNLIPPVSNNPLIEIIADIETKWRDEAATKYPSFFKKGDGAGFKRYFACELETLSDTTLAHYYNRVQEALSNGYNLVEDRHNLLRQRQGLEALA